MKYEMIFGDESLFDGAEADVIAIRVNDYKKITYYHHNEEDLKSKSMQDSHAIPLIAMRRIIKTPVWTVEDRKAGRLPEVLAKVDGGVVVFVNSFNVVTVLESGAVIVSSPKTFLNTFKPIESQEEKAARLREEWVDKATFMKTYEIYDQLLSGDLPVPVKE